MRCSSFQPYSSNVGHQKSPSQSQRQPLRKSLSLARRLAGGLSRILANGMAGVAIGMTVAATMAMAPHDALARQTQPYAEASLSGAGGTTGMAGMAGTIAVPQLPNEAQRTLERIQSGGPYPYEKDGSRFGNYERILPQQPRGYYREYTVKTNSRNRGARRIVCGGDQRAANDCYYTEDHYNSFKRITK